MNNMTLLVGAVVVIFIVIVIVGMIVDKKKTWKILQWVLVGLGIVLLGWIAKTFKVNIGKYLSNITGSRKNLPTSILNLTGEQIGESVDIVTSKNPIRDRGVIKISDGQTIALPKGIMDSDVERVTIIDTGYSVEVKNEKSTDIFDASNSASG